MITRPGGRIAARVLMVLVCAFLIAPVLVVVLFAFQKSARLALPFEGFSLRWFRQIFSEDQFSNALVTSLKVALGVGFLSATIGYLGARALLGSSRVVRTVAMAAALPSIFPSLLVSLGCALLLHRLKWAPGVGPTIVGQTIMALPFAALVMLARVRNLDPDYVRASRDLGASEWTTFRRVTFPLVRGAILAAACLAMALSLDEFVIAFFAGAGSPTVPVVLWGLLRRGVDPSANATAVVLLVLCCGLIAVAIRQLGKDLERI
jgi:spermidine/putrescine transport system permease protein